MALVRQPKTAGFRPISKYEITYLVVKVLMQLWKCLSLFHRCDRLA